MNSERYHLFIFWIKRIKKNWLSFLIKLVLYLAPITLIIPDISIFFINKPLLVFAFLIVVFLINELLIIKELEKSNIEIEELVSENENLKKKQSELERYAESIGLYLENTPNEFIINVSKYLKFKNSERISLYVLDGENFRIIGRYSENPRYTKNGRCKYPSNCGYISKCLENNDGKEYFYRDNLPKKNDSYQRTVSNETGMSREEINNLSMQSRTYFTRVIKDRYNKNVGILVLESINPHLSESPESLNEKLEELIIPHLSTFLGVSNKLIGENSNE